MRTAKTGTFNNSHSARTFVCLINESTNAMQGQLFSSLVMKMSPYFSLIFFVIFLTLESSSQLIINELDPSMQGVDDKEFVELIGNPNENLDGYIVVVFNGSNGQSNLTIDLSGYALDAAGFFLIGGPAMTEADLIIEETNWLQVGQEAVAIYDASASVFPDGTAVTNSDLLDAIVYGNNQPPMLSLLDVLTPGGVQLNESAEGLADFQSFSRLPDGGAPVDPAAFELQSPTPGYSNILQCDGGQLALLNASDESVCTDNELVLVQLVHSTDVPTVDLTLLVVNALDESILAVFEGSAVNLSGFGDQELEVWGVSHDAPLAESSIQPGQPAALVSGTGCASMSINTIAIQGITCSPPACDGGIVTDAGGTPSALGCDGLENAIITFGYTSEAVEAEYIFVITDDSQTILDTIAFPQYDFSELGVGNYQVWGSSALGGFDSTTLEAGQPLSGVMGMECDSLSSSYLDVQILDCESASFCEEIFISEYVEGNSNNKAFELYNPSPVAIDLSEYSMETWNNGASAATNTQVLEGMIEPNDVFVIVNTLAAPELFGAGDLVSQVTWFNGNDVILLYHNGVIIDQMGEFGVDPGTAFEVDGGNGEMAEYTLVRKANVSQGTTDWDLGQFQWDVYPSDTFDFIGFHNATCTGSPEMEIGFAATDLYVFEGGGAEVVMQVAYPLQDVNVVVDVVGGSAEAGSDFPSVFPLPTYTFPIGSLNDQSFTFAAINDEDPEGEETVELSITITSGEATLLIDTVTIHIQPSDLTYPVYNIADVRTVDGVLGITDSLDVSCELRGIVHGWNDYPAGLQFTLIDATDGINVFSPISDFGYNQVVAGDSLRIRGTIHQFAGLTQIIADTVIYEGSGFLTEEPELIQTLDEITESHVVTLKCVELVDAAQWTNSAPSFEVDITTGNTVYTMRIDANTDLFLTEAPVGTFLVSGIADQRDFEAPYFEGYRISPRYQSDITEPVYADFDIVSPWNPNDGPLQITNNSEGASSYYWDFGNNESSDAFEPEFSYTEDGTFEISLVAYGTDGNCLHQTTATVEIIVVGLDEMTSNTRFWPNPTQDVLFMESSIEVQAIQVHTLQGKRVYHETINGRVTSFSTKGWPAGLYVVSVGTKSGWAQYKLVKS